MSNEAVIDFLKSLDENEQLQKELAALPEKSREAAKVVQFAKEHGFNFTASELEQEAGSHAAATGKAISEKELANVVGGMSIPTQFGRISSNLLLSVHSFSSMASKFKVG